MEEPNELGNEKVRKVINMDHYAEKHVVGRVSGRKRIPLSYRRFEWEWLTLYTAYFLYERVIKT